MRILCRMKITFLPHALEQMEERGISEEQARATLEALSFDDLAMAVEERGGKLDVPEKLAAHAR